MRQRGGATCDWVCARGKIGRERGMGSAMLQVGGDARAT
jgi:hypothetical protein